MPRLLSVLTAAMLVTPLFVGCCAHRTHADERATDGEHPADLLHAGETSPLSCLHGSASPTSPRHERTADHQHPGHQNCQGAKCSFVRTAHEITRVLLVARVWTSVAPLLNDPSSVFGIFSQQRFLPTGRLLLAARLHLVNQVLLI
jgi:hypothetical protein